MRPDVLGGGDFFLQRAVVFDLFGGLFLEAKGLAPGEWGRDCRPGRERRVSENAVQASGVSVWQLAGDPGE